ncbi:MAG: hypothetical protein Q9M36_06300 [Sulfurovum sp.]|nr:hypothetical protein [Sulfurovum sp.]
MDKDQKIVIGHKFLEKGKVSEIPAFQELLDEKVFNKEASSQTTTHFPINSIKISINERKEVK